MNPEVTGTERPTDIVSRSSALANLSEKIQPGLRKILEGDGWPKMVLRNVLHGTFIGHPLHPLLTDIPIGA